MTDRPAGIFALLLPFPGIEQNTSAQMT